MRVKRKVVRAYKSLTNAECRPVELYKKSLSHVPKEIGDDTFYLVVTRMDTLKYGEKLKFMYIKHQPTLVVLPKVYQV